MSKLASLQSEKEAQASSYRTEVLGASDPYSWNAAIHYVPKGGTCSDRPNTVNVSVGSISALIKRFG